MRLPATARKRVASNTSMPSKTEDAVAGWPTDRAGAEFRGRVGSAVVAARQGRTQLPTKLTSANKVIRRMSPAMCRSHCFWEEVRPVGTSDREHAVLRVPKLRGSTRMEWRFGVHSSPSGGRRSDFDVRCMDLSSLVRFLAV